MILIVLRIIGIIGVFPTLLMSLSFFDLTESLPFIVLTLIPMILEIIAFCYAFSPASNEWFLSGRQLGMRTSTNTGVQLVNETWKKTIFYTNIVSIVVYLILILAIDLPIGLSSSELLPFWYIMLVVFAGYLVFFVLETFVFRKKFSTSVSGLDSGILTVILLRNILFLLNFIPFIQLIGLIGLPTLGVILLIIYIIMIMRRFPR